MDNLKETALAAVMAVTFIAAPVMAYEAGDFIARVSPAGVYPTGESDDLDAVPTRLNMTSSRKAI